MKKILFLILFIIMSDSVFAENLLYVGKFSDKSNSNQLLTQWKPLNFKKIEKHTDYNLVRFEDRIIVKAVTNASASGLIRNIEIDLNEYPVIQWDWKVENVYKKGNVKKKKGDDYPARIYITFKYDPAKVGFFEKVKFKTVKAIYGKYPPISAINYIFASKADKGVIVSNPYVDRVKMIVVDSGETDTGKWIHHKRNIFKDYKKAFKALPPLVSGVAIMSDSDNTGERAVAYYGDIIFKKN